MSESLDFLLVGGGIAGLLLQEELSSAGYSTRLFDLPQENSSTVIAAGIVNPVAGKFFALSWRATDFFPGLAQFYAELENRWGSSFFHPRPMHRVLQSAGEQNTWLSKAHLDKYRDFCSYSEADEDHPYGILSIRYGGNLDTVAFVQAGHKHHHARLLRERFDFGQLDLQVQRYGKQRFGHIVFCEGSAVRHNPYFKHLPFSPNKGEVLTIHSDGLSENVILTGGVFVLPLGQGRFRVGASYDHHDLSMEPTEKARAYLVERLERMISVPYRIIDQRVGIRPAVQDRRPIMGRHPAHSCMSVFNGLGSKGVSMAPRLASEMFAHLVDNTNLHPDCDVKRYS